MKIFKVLAVIAGLVFLLGFDTNAQITLTESDMVQIGGVCVLANDTFPKVSPGLSGANQTWNLTALTNEFPETLWVEDPSLLPNYADFSNANIGEKIVENRSTQYVFATENSNELATLGDSGYEGDISEINTAKPAIIDISLPCTFNTTWKGTYRNIEKVFLAGEYSVEYITSTSYIDSADGWGILFTPAGTYNALRVIGLSTPLYDSVFEWNGTSFVFYSATTGGIETKSVEWYGNGNGYPLAILDLPNASSNLVGSGSYLVSYSVGIDEISDNSTAAVYPNPASSFINIVVKSSSQDGYIKIVDLAGREIETSLFRNGKAQFSTSTYTNGMYLYLITDMNGNLLDKGKFCVNH